MGTPSRSTQVVHAILLALCLTMSDVKNEGCRVMCIRDGYASGKSNKNSCVCVDVKESYEGFANRSMGLGPRPDVPFIPESKAKSSSITIDLPEYPEHY